MRYEKDRWIFSSGRTRYAYTERLSISDNQGDPQISYGSDGGFWDAYSEEYSEDKLSTEDLLELAEMQIKRWQDFANHVRASSTVTGVTSAEGAG